MSRNKLKIDFILNILIIKFQDGQIFYCYTSSRWLERLGPQTVHVNSLEELFVRTLDISKPDYHVPSEVAQGTSECCST